MSPNERPKKKKIEWGDDRKRGSTEMILGKSVVDHMRKTHGEKICKKNTIKEEGKGRRAKKNLGL